MSGSSEPMPIHRYPNGDSYRPAAGGCRDLDPRFQSDLRYAELAPHDGGEFAKTETTADRIAPSRGRDIGP
ncbi:hypothetical protein EC9_45470 [Rosistilla ulvae]|uniref:Uncharacterized protein n=1 Tax=Rosistilla ulvae TaxID=1930277 RepID=A0A517M635_9BACT|nr:hypothetical protein EC9_45470 [Rosistilla ulvae]